MPRVRLTNLFLHRFCVQRISGSGDESVIPLRQIDNFCMRNFTNDAVFDDTLPIADSLLEVGSLVPLERLHSAMEDWFRRKGYLSPSDRLRFERLSSSSQA